MYSVPVSIRSTGISGVNKLVIVFFLFMAGMSAGIANSGTDLHRLWDDRCEECHGHSGEFSRKFLNVFKGELQGSHHIDDLELFLHNHYLSGQLVDEMYYMLLAQVSIQPRFNNECSGCHQNAADFVREKLVLEDSVLKIQNTGERVKDFLKGHRGLNNEDVMFYTELLKRVADEVNIP